MNSTEQLQDVIKRQAEEIRSLRAERRVLKQERRAYRRFYLRVMFRYSDLIGLLEEERARYAKIVCDPHAIGTTNGSEPTRDSQRQEKGPLIAAPPAPG